MKAFSKPTNGLMKKEKTGSLKPVFLCPSFVGPSHTPCQSEHYNYPRLAQTTFSFPTDIMDTGCMGRCLAQAA